MHVVYAARYRIDIGLHVFPTEKYRLVHDRLVARQIVDAGASTQAGTTVEPKPATWDELALVHTGEYLDKMRTGALSREDVAQLQLPWSAEMVEGFRLMVGGTIDAACLACDVPRDNEDTHRPPSFAFDRAGRGRGGSSLVSRMA